ncbi:MAG: NYN domain-containing protein [Saprospiraceae bacterium]
MNVIVYIDGYNFFIAMKHKKSPEWQNLNEIDLVKLSQKYIEKYDRNATLVKVKLFMAIPHNNLNYKMENFQEYIGRHLSAYPSQFQFIKGRLTDQSRQCHHCCQEIKWRTEKLTDVNLSVEMVHDALTADVDAMYLISADSDFESPIKLSYKSYKKSILLIIPPSLSSYGLYKFCKKQKEYSSESQQDHQIRMVRMNKHFPLVQQSQF